MGKRLILALVGLGLVGTTALPAALAAPLTDNGCQAANPAPPKAKERKPAENRDKKRSPSGSLGRGCLGCIVPLDGMSSTMAVGSYF